MSTRRQAEKLRIELGELLAAQEGPDLDEYGVYADDPAGFLSDVLGARLWPRLVDVCHAVRDHGLVAVRSANGIGKTWLLPRLLLWHVYARRGMGIASSTTERQVKDAPFRELRQAWASAGLPGALYEAPALIVDRTADLVVYGFTSKDVSKLSGYHTSAPGGLMVWLDECQGAEDYALEGAIACATAANDTVVGTGNPIFKSGVLYEISRAPHWHDIAISALEHPNITGQGDPIPGAISPEGIQRIADQWGEGSDQYRSRVLAEFPQQDVNALVRDEWLEWAVENHERGKDDRGAHVRLGVDVGRTVDSTVVAIVRGNRLIECRDFQRTDSYGVVNIVGGILREFLEFDRYGPLGSYTVVTDAAGIGAGVADMLREGLGENALDFLAGAGATSQRYANRRAESFWNLRTMLEQAKVALPYDRELFEELRAMTWSLDGSGRILVGGKAALRSELGRSTDRADAVAMALTAPVQQRMVIA